jgi:hypothetical protein
MMTVVANSQTVVGEVEVGDAVVDRTPCRIRSLEVSGGFLDGQRFEFVDGLNCIIGGRGAGKTSTLEFIRFVLDAYPKSAGSAGERRRLDNLMQANLAGGRVQLKIEMPDGLTLVVSRVVGEEPMVLTESGEPMDFALGGVFRVHIYSQNELEQIAERSEQQLTLLDSLASDRIGPLDKEIAETRSQLRALAASANPLVMRLAELDGELAMLPGVEEKLLTLAGNASKRTDGQGAAINAAHGLKALRDREQRSVVDCGLALKDRAVKAAALKASLASVVNGVDETDLERSPNKELLAHSDNVARRCVRLVQQALESVDALSRSLLCAPASTGGAHRSGVRQVCHRVPCDRFRDFGKLPTRRGSLQLAP